MPHHPISMNRAKPSGLLRTLFLPAAMSLALLVSAGCEKDSNDNSSQSANTSTSSGSSSSRGSDNSSSSQSSASWGVSHYSGTGIAPTAGDYDFSAGGNPGYFEVTSGGLISFSIDNYAHYSVPVHDGAFYYRNGLLSGSDSSSDSGNMYPSDGFCIGGHFTSSSNAEGSISYASNGEITGGPVSFTATKK